MKTINSIIYDGNKYKISVDQKIEGVENCYTIIKTLENYTQHLPILYEIQNYIF